MQPIDFLMMAGVGLVLFVAGVLRERWRDRRWKAEQADRIAERWERLYEREAEAYRQRIRG